jgi:ubiquinone/menaquinone biosynthesis C-methylase UbiE
LAEQEFDHYAEDYSPAGSRLYGLIGSSARTYLEVKVDHLLRTLARTQISAGDPRVRFLDFGCGTGDFLSVLRDRSVAWSMEGCDVSSGMLRTAAERHPELSPAVRLWNCAEDALPESAFGLITAVSVLHHIPPDNLMDTLRRLWRALSPGGVLCVYEHNPWNPVTRFMVARLPIDKNAVLISQRTLLSHVRAAGAGEPWLSNLLFFPPRLRFARRVEGVLERIPLGGQYLMMTLKPA